MKTLICKTGYRNAARGLSYEPGQVISDLPDMLAFYLMNDSPGTFEEPAKAETIRPAMTEPPVNKMVQSPPVAKRHRGKQ